MRIRGIQTLLQIHNPALQESISGTTTQDGREALKFDHLPQYRAAVNAVAAIKALEPFTKPVLELPIVTTETRESLIILRPEANSIVEKMRALAFAAEQLRALLDSTVQEERETSLAIGLPDTSDIAEFAQTIAEVGAYLHKFTGIPIGDEDAVVPAMELEGLDIGSTWLIVAANTPLVVKFFGWVYRGIIDLKTYGRQKEAEVQMLEAMSEDTRDAVELNKKIRRAIARQLAVGIVKKTSPKAGEEDINRLAALLREGEPLIDRRVSFCASLKAPEDVRSAFPPPALPGRSESDLLLSAAAGPGQRLLTEGDGADAASETPDPDDKPAK